jgi:hypothetical protein
MGMANDEQRLADEFWRLSLPQREMFVMGAKKRMRELVQIQEAKNRPNIDWQEKIHREILRGLRNISETA